MLIEQIIEFELKGLGSPGHTCTATTGYFHDKGKISNQNHSTWAKSHTKLNPKTQDFKRVFDLNC